MKILTFTAVLAAALGSGLAIIPFVPEANDPSLRGVFEIRAQAESAGMVRVYFDDGDGFRETLTATLPLRAGSEQLLRFPLPAVELRALRYDPIDSSNPVTLAAPRVLDARGRVVRDIALEAFRLHDQIARAEVVGARLEVVPSAPDPQLLLAFTPPLDFRARSLTRALHFVVPAAFLLAAVLGLLWLVERSAGLRARSVALWRWSEAHPLRALALGALVAAVASSYPVVFLGRSFVSPNFTPGPRLLYENLPTLPGYDDASTEDPKGSDVGALPWHHHPLSIIEHRAVFRDGELPLFNRYNLGGSVVLGQGQSMFGDPLHLVPLLANGAAWAWDLKFVLAKWLFACGIGWTVWAAVRHLPSALLAGASAAFIGLFAYRLNHPAFFSVCYAPWILYAWLRITQAPDARTTTRWILALLAACWCEITSGTVKEAYVLTVLLNATGGLMLLWADRTWRERLWKFAGASAGLALFVLISAPHWVTFLDALARASTHFERPVVHQIHPAVLVGFFDELFYRALHRDEPVWNPAVNFLALGGLLYLVATVRTAARDGFVRAGLVSASVVAAAIFGMIPPAWIAAVPFIGNVAHLDSTFSCVLIVLVLVLAGCGYRIACARLAGPEGRGDLMIAGALLGVVLGPYLALTHVWHRTLPGAEPTFIFQTVGEQLPLSPFVHASLLLLSGALIALALVAQLALRRRRWTSAGAIIALTCLSVLLWRHGQHSPALLADYVFNPGPRVDFHAASPTINYLRGEQAREPFRVVGLGSHLFPGWTAAYDLESTGGPDALVNRRYRELIDGAGLDLGWEWVITPRRENLARERPFYDFLNVRHYVDHATERARVGAVLEPRWQGDLDVYASPTAWPRAFFTDRVALYDTPATLARMVREGDGRPFAVLTTSDRAHTPQITEGMAERVVVPATNYRLTTNTTSFEITTPSAGLIVLHETWWKEDFRVTLNGRRVDYLRVNHAFKGITVDGPGVYHVTFSYWPRTLTLTLVLAAFGLAALSGGCWWVLRRDRARAWW